MVDDMRRDASAFSGRGGMLPVEIQMPPEGMQIPSFYTNAVQLALSVFDLKLLFGVTVSSDGHRAIMRPIADVVMSPQHAKALAAILVRARSSVRR